MCGDYKGTVNPAIQTEQFPIPTLEEIRGRVSSWKKFTKVDLRSAYQQLVLDEEAQKLCTINTHKGLFRYTRLPFGISSSPAIWQRFIEQVLAEVDGTCVIMDDLLVGGSNDEEHLRNLEAVFMQFKKFGLRVKVPKCVFMAPSVVYFGLRFSEYGLQPTDKKVQAIKEAPTPRNVTELRSFLGMVAALTNFIPKLSTLAHPLYELLGNTPWNWSPGCDKAFCPNVRDCANALRPKASCGTVGGRLSVWVGRCNNARLSQWQPTPDCLCVTYFERTRKTLRADRQRGVGNYVWTETFPLVPVRASLHYSNGS